MTSLPHHPLQLKKKNLDIGFSWVVGDNDKPSNSSSSLSFFSSFADDKLEGLSSFFDFFPHV
jgi:hypothetical protein